ncbi:hypothetical protein B0H21DRAFT_889451 [Amylocystis lapponica]|nr:hypothetical protein B0H21DRAFT_889451 [Amylocystis lapponica]
MYLTLLSRDDDDKTDRCEPIAHWLRLCIVDIFTILVVLFMVWYIIWGIPLTLRFIKWSKAKLAAKRSARSLKKLCLRSSLTSASEKTSYIDPYLSPTRRLCKYLTRSRQHTMPKPVYYQSESYAASHENSVADPFAFPTPSSHEDPALPVPRPMSALICSVSELLATPLSPGSSSIHFTDSSLYSPDPKSPALATPPPAYLDFYAHARDRPMYKPC